MSRALVARIVTVATAVWLMFAPAVIGYDGVAASNDRIFGPIAGSFAFVACWDVLMPMRWPTLPLGLWLVAAPPILGYDHAGAWVSSIVAGIVIAATAFVGHDVSDEFGGGWRSIRPAAWTDSAPSNPG
jgi:hypothetical protein